MTKYTNPDDSKPSYDGIIYDLACSEIGSTTGKQGANDFDIDSQLEYVVVANFFYVHFWYAGNFYGWSRHQCITYDADVFPPTQVWQCAFNC
jgi:hypothetical protein